jgi:hypothetical protein
MLMSSLRGKEETIVQVNFNRFFKLESNSDENWC